MIIFFINHKEQQCGVYQYGKRLGHILTKSTNIQFIYKEISILQEYRELCQQEYDAIIYNYHASTLPWLHNSTIQMIKPNIAVYHESGSFVSFDYFINNDPNSPLTSVDLPIPRPLADPINSNKISTNIPTFGTFGFGFGNKGYAKIIIMVNQQFDEALIKVHIPFAKFGDAEGNQSKSQAQILRSIPVKPGIKIEITHDFFTDEQLMNFLNSNTLNIFLYDTMYGRGCSSVIDYAIMADTPLAISNSDMFRHIYHDDICAYKTPLQTIINNGTKYIESLREKWSHEKLIATVEQFCNRICRTVSTIINPLNNTLLNDDYRLFLKPEVQELYSIVPDMMARKIPRANVQQAFVYKFIKENFQVSLMPKILCVGSHEDTCCAALKKLHYDITEVDNKDVTNLTNYYEQYDFIFSISVIGYVNNDSKFMHDLCKCLKPNGTCIVICDYNDNCKRKPISANQHRFYTYADLMERFKTIIEKNNCAILGEIDYSAAYDFIYDHNLYSFATLTFIKCLPH